MKSVAPSQRHRQILLRGGASEEPRDWAAQETEWKEQPPLTHRQLRRVCEICNIGWMNGLQQEARPFVSDLINGVWNLTPKHSQVIGRWIAMIAMNIDDSYPDTRSTHPDAIAAMRQGDYPPHWFTFVAPYSGPHDIGYWKRSFQSFQAAMLGGEGFHGHVITIHLKQLIMQAIQFPADDPPVKREYLIEIGRHLPMFPVHPWGMPELDWPTIPTLRPAQIPAIVEEFVAVRGVALHIAATRANPSSETGES